VRVAILFATFGCFEICIAVAAELTLENSSLSPLGFINHVRVRLLLSRVLGLEAVSY
jgi:hypothetical protein